MHGESLAFRKRTGPEGSHVCTIVVPGYGVHKIVQLSPESYIYCQGRCDLKHRSSEKGLLNLSKVWVKSGTSTSGVRNGSKECMEGDAVITIPRQGARHWPVNILTEKTPTLSDQSSTVLQASIKALSLLAANHPSEFLSNRLDFPSLPLAQVWKDTGGLGCGDYPALLPYGLLEAPT